MCSTDLVEYPRAEHSLEEVVADENPPQVEGFAVLHEPGSQDLGEVSVEETDAQCGQRRTHHRPVVDPRI